MKNIQAVLTLYKNRGETPLECLERFKRDHFEYKNEKITYAGRLDPLAEGLLLVLVGEECKNKEKYLGFDKEYEVDVLFGFSTDTYDVLGKVIKASGQNFIVPVGEWIKSPQIDNKDFITKSILRFFDKILNITETKSTDPTNQNFYVRGSDKINELLNSFIGRFSQKYPPFSSKTIRGKTLFSLFKKKELKDEEIPEKEVEIKSIELLQEKTISKKHLKRYIIESVNSVKGDFRQNEILEAWKSAFGKIALVDTGIHETGPSFNEIDNNISRFNIVSIRVNCTSGTYMRSLANSIGEKVGIPALALNIKRTKIGDSF